MLRALQNYNRPCLYFRKTFCTFYGAECCSLSYGARELSSRIKNDPILTYSCNGLEFMAVAVARGGSDTNRHLNLEDQLDNAHYFCPNVV